MRIFILSIITLFSLSLFAQSPVLRLASDTWPPFTNVEKEKSIAMDLVKEALARTGVKVDYTIVEFDDVISGIDEAKYDGSAALWKDREREEKYVFSKPYLHNQLILVGKKGSDVSAGSFDELSGKRIGVVKNYSYKDFSGSEIEVVSGNSDQQNLSRLLSGQVDYMLVDNLLLQYLLKYQVNDVHKFLEVAKTPIMVKPLHFALRKDVDDAESIIDGFNEQIGEMIADGTYNRILELNWVRADMDGDGKMELVLSGDAAGTKPPEYAYDVHSGSFEDGTMKQQRFYVNGKIYNSWDQIPEDYKKEIVMGAIDPENTGIKLNFK